MEIKNDFNLKNFFTCRPLWDNAGCFTFSSIYATLAGMEDKDMYGSDSSRPFGNTGFSASMLKTIACITMFIDHLGATLIYELDARGAFASIFPGKDLFVYSMFRLVGRIAFVLFAFLLAEGFTCTSDKRRYFLRLLSGAVISEIPFNLISSRQLFDLWNRNVFFTLLIGFCTLWGIEAVSGPEKTASARKSEQHAAEQIRFSSKALRILFIILIILAGMLTAEILRTDYGCLGVGLIAAFYLLRNNKMALVIGGAMVYYIMDIVENFCHYIVRVARDQGFERMYIGLSQNWSALLRTYSMQILGNTMSAIIAAMLLIMSYNGTKGRQLPKTFYYLFYPIHMLVLYFALRLFLHLG